MCSKVAGYRGQTFMLVVGCLTPAAARASGDPGVIWWMAGLILFQLAGAALLSWVPMFRGIRKPALVVYVLVLVPVWFWALNVPGPDFSRIYTGLIGVPAILLIAAGAVARVKGRGT
jgi:hypothetical protein